MTISLRDTLLAALRRLPGRRHFHVHVLVSSPRKHGALFPFASPRPRTYVQDVLVLLSEQADKPDAPRLLVTAVEACVYHVAATSSAILYVSKVDSTGQAASPSPTPTIVRSLLLFYADPTTRPVAADHLWIQLFARAQGQYLFPNSAEFEGKKPLGDVKLCAWWKRILTEVATDLQTRLPSGKVQLHYILPGCGEFEAEQMLKSASSSGSTTTELAWVYGHPYKQPEIPLPCPPDTSEGTPNLGHYIPSFDDDPKSRFIDEIAYTTEGEIKSPVRKRAKTMTGDDGSRSEEKEGGEEKNEIPLGELRKVTPDEFWERMSFRQECVAGAVTGFFTVVVSCAGHSEAPGLGPQPGQVSSQISKRVRTCLTTGSEFSTVERSIRATEVVEGTIKKLCDGIASRVPGPGGEEEKEEKTRGNDEESGRRTPERGLWPTAAPPMTPPRRGRRRMVSASPLGLEEGVTSLETYRSQIYGSVFVDNPDRMVAKQGGVATGEHVTVLAVRKKIKIK